MRRLLFVLLVLLNPPVYAQESVRVIRFDSISIH